MQIKVTALSTDQLAMLEANKQSYINMEKYDNLVVLNSDIAREIKDVLNFIKSFGDKVAVSANTNYMPEGDINDLVADIEVIETDHMEVKPPESTTKTNPPSNTTMIYPMSHPVLPSNPKYSAVLDVTYTLLDDMLNMGEAAFESGMFASNHAKIARGLQRVKARVQRINANMPVPETD